MNAARWKYLKALTPPAPRYLHTSAAVAMLPQPTDPLMPSIPWTQRPGDTYNVGRNAEKRRRRADAKSARALTR